MPYSGRTALNDVVRACCRGDGYCAELLMCKNVSWLFKITLELHILIRTSKKPKYLTAYQMTDGRFPRGSSTESLFNTSY